VTILNVFFENRAAVEFCGTSSRNCCKLSVAMRDYCGYAAGGIFSLYLLESGVFNKETGALCQGRWMRLHYFYFGKRTSWTGNQMLRNRNNHLTNAYQRAFFEQIKRGTNDSDEAVFNWRKRIVCKTFVETPEQRCECGTRYKLNLGAE